MDITSGRSVYGLFRAFAESQPQREWLVYETPDGEAERYTYAEFLGRVHQASHLLQSLGLNEADTLNLHLANHPAHALLTLAASLLGLVVVPTNPVSTTSELDYILQHAAVRVVFTQDEPLEIARQVSTLNHVLVCGGNENGHYPVLERELERFPTEPPPRLDYSEKVVQILYTSGTTSRPKGVVMTNANVLYAAETVRAAIGARPDDRFLVALPLFHGAAQFHGLWPALVTGGTAVIVPRFSASRFFEQAIRYDATMAPMFGAPLRMLLNQPRRPADDQHRIRNITFAQNLTERQYREWHERFKARLQQLWGMTETVSVPIMSPLTGERNLMAMGRPILGYEVRIVDEQDRDVAVGQTGQLIVRGTPGRTVMVGYFRDPDATARVLRSRPDGTWVYSGDMAYADDNGFIYFVDRDKDLIKRAGERISSVEIESVVRRCEGVRDAAIVTIPDPVRDELIVAVVVADDATLTDEAVKSFCRAYLSPFKVPERVVFVDELPRTSVGKIQKHMLRQQLMTSGPDAWAASASAVSAGRREPEATDHD